jgi:hypothetical protein
MLWRAIVIVSVLLAIPIVALALWISLAQGESIYRFFAEFDSNRRLGEMAWQVIERCRIVAWLLLPVAIAMIAACGVMLWSILRPASFTIRVWRCSFGALWIAAILAVVLEAYWIPRMLPTVVLRDGMSANQTAMMTPPPPPDTRNSD